MGSFGENSITVSGQKFYSYMDCRDLPEVGAEVEVEYDERTKLCDSPLITSDTPFLRKMSVIRDAQPA